MAPERKLKSAQQARKIIDDYLTGCEGVPALDPETGAQITTKYGPAWIKPPQPPTPAGLALALGFASRHAMYQYIYAYGRDYKTVNISDIPTEDNNVVNNNISDSDSNGNTNYVGSNKGVRAEDERVYISDEITRAMTVIEDYATVRLYDRDGQAGAKFALSAIHKWSTTERIEVTTRTDEVTPKQAAEALLALGYSKKAPKTPNNGRKTAETAEKGAIAERENVEISTIE